MEEKTVEVTIKKDGVVYSGKPAPEEFLAKGDKVKVSEETAASLKEKGYA